MDKNDIIEYVMNTPHNTNRAVLSSMLNQLTEGGGGGSSDFSTAQVTLVNGGMITLPVIREADPSQGAPAHLMVVRQALEAGTYSVPLYKGGLLVNLPSIVTVSGSIQYMGDVYYITGDCTITISGGGKEYDG